MILIKTWCTASSGKQKWNKDMGILTLSAWHFCSEWIWWLGRCEHCEDVRWHKEQYEVNSDSPIREWQQTTEKWGWAWVNVAKKYKINSNGNKSYMLSFESCSQMCKNLKLYNIDAKIIDSDKTMHTKHILESDNFYLQLDTMSLHNSKKCNAN